LFEAVREIRPGEELTFCYGRRYFESYCGPVLHEW